MSRLLVGVVCLATGSAAGWAGRAVVAERDASRVAAHASGQREAALHAGLLTLNAQLRAQSAAARHAQATLRAAQDDARALAADDRLRADRAEALAARCAAGDSASSDGGPSAADSGRMLADMHRRADEMASFYARVATERGAAGAACVESYEALTPLNTHQTLEN